MITGIKKSSQINNDGTMGYQYEFMGLHTDTKPTTCTGNSLFLELDTGDFYYFDGSKWNKVGG